jgi:hypothetical protein
LLIRLLVQVLAAGLTLYAAGCGGDDEPERRNTPNPPAQTAPGRTQTTPRAKTETQKPTSPEDQPGGAGDEEPARSDAYLIASGNRIGPRVVRVPPFIAVRVILRTGDGRAHALRIAGETLRVGPHRQRDITLLEGLRPDGSYVGRPIGRGKPVRIEASAEPGP